jgi:DNA-binding response OmpR family regulator
MTILMPSTITDPHSSCSEEECAIDFDYGFHAYLCNMTYRQIVAYARAILRTIQHSKSPREVLEVGHIRMDLARHELRVEDKIVDLTPREFMIMKAFMERPGVVVSRADLLNRVWGEDYALIEHSLDVHIHALRKKIGQCPPNPGLILTVRGFGDKLEAGAGAPLLSRRTRLSKAAGPRPDRTLRKLRVPI